MIYLFRIFIYLTLILLTINCSNTKENDKIIYDNVKFHEESNNEDHDHEENSHQEESKIKSGKAVSKADEKKGIQLDVHVIKLLKIETKPIQKYKISKNTYKIPKSSVVFFEDQAGIFYQLNGWFNLQKVKIHNQMDKTIYISTSSLNSQVNLVISGVPLLRLSYLEAFGASGEGHGH